MNNMTNSNSAVMSPSDVLNDSELDSVYAFLEANNISDVEFDVCDSEYDHEFRSVAIDMGVNFGDLVIVILRISFEENGFYVDIRRNSDYFGIACEFFTRED